MRFPTGHIICAAIGFGLLGAAKGLDEGLIAITVNLPSFVREYDLHASDLSAAARANRLSNITSMVHLGSLPAALLAFLLSDLIGPLWTMRQLCLLWIIGVVIVITSAGESSQLIAGRFIMGLGIGQAGIIGPIYLAEVAPTAWRGLLVGIYASSEYIGILIGYFAGYGASLHLSNNSDQQWIVPQSCQIMLSGVLLLFSLGCVESPRYLCKTNRTDQAARALGRLRRLPSDSPSIVDEVRVIEKQVAVDKSKEGRWPLLEPWKLLFGQAANRSRLLFLISAQLLSQWSGTNAITTYAPKFFSLLGVTGKSEKLLKTAIFGAVKLAAALFCAIFFIDQIGRKRSLMAGITLQLLALLYVAIYLTVTTSLSSDTHSGDVHRAAIAAIASIYVTGIGYAFGWNSVQYLINAEMLPSSVRTLGTSILMCIHYANRFALTKAVPTMMLADALQPKGTFWFFFVVAFLGFLWGMFLLPETSRKNLEETSEMIR
ncbi:general substrate transporter [Aspergillus sclerotiicarbonarius CBS 121057]|uniref:General substrate transporter n=1 Tax=Aspergillus sclerotiicarbonarius (strain CBS 121057 / IBT 28362) TaxID=1448318 RepID=A0A319ELP0_ASPSB|nr:general substrate transporter [Aspergillus sclerotiicarbonarius CBS 121057]